MNTKELETTIDGVLKPLGFKKRGPTWFRHCTETILVMDLQKSDYGGQYYVNLAIALVALGPAEYPREELCDIRMRLDELFDDRKTVTKVFDLENLSIKVNERRIQIQGLIGKGARWLDALSTTNAIIQELSSNKSVRNRTIVQARRFLKVD